MKPLLTTLANYLSRIDAGEKKKSPELLFKRQTLLKEAPLPDRVFHCLQAGLS